MPKEKSNAAWLRDQLAHDSASPFIRACQSVGVIPGIREASKWRQGKGKALKAAWAQHPKSKNLPRVREDN